MIFAAISLPLATLALVHFINHRYDGLPLWNLRGQPFVHETVWILNFISFFFLYPSTFNLLEVCSSPMPLSESWHPGYREGLQERLFSVEVRKQLVCRGVACVNGTASYVAP